MTAPDCAPVTPEQVIAEALDRHVRDYSARLRDDPPTNENCAKVAVQALRDAGWLLFGPRPSGGAA